MSTVDPAQDAESVRCQCPCHSLTIPHPITCPDCQPLPVSWYACGFCGADKHHCCRSTASDRRYPMGWFHQHRETVARQLNLRRGLRHSDGSNPPSPSGGGSAPPATGPARSGLVRPEGLRHSDGSSVSGPRYSQTPFATCLGGPETPDDCTPPELIDGQEAGS